MSVSNSGLFSDINISHNSVATLLRCGGISIYHFTANLLLNQIVKGLWKSVKIWRSYRHEFCGLLFLEHSVYNYNSSYFSEHFMQCWGSYFLKIICYSYKLHVDKTNLLQLLVTFYTLVTCYSYCYFLKSLIDWLIEVTLDRPAERPLRELESIQWAVTRMKLQWWPHQFLDHMISVSDALLLRYTKRQWMVYILVCTTWV